MAVHEEVDHAIDHAKVIVTIELLFQIDEVAVHSVEPPREETAQVQADRRIRLEHGHGILDDAKAARFDRPHFSRVRHPEEGGKVSENGARFVGAGHRDSALGHLDGTFDEEIDQPGGSTFGDHRLSGVEAAKRLMVEKVEQ